MRNKVMVSIIVVTMLAAVGALISVGRSSASARRPREAGTRAAVAQPQTSSSNIISGRVLDPEGNPVAGAEVRAFGARQHIGKVPSAVTDEHGAFFFEDLRPGVYDISASKEEEGYGDTWSGLYSADGFQNPRVIVSPGQVAPNVVVHLGPQCVRLIVRVNDRQTGKKLGAGPNMQIKLRRADRPGVSEATGTDESGDFSILVPPADYSVEISIPGYKKWHYHGTRATAPAKAQRGSPARKKELAASLDRDQ